MGAQIWSSTVSPCFIAQTLSCLIKHHYKQFPRILSFLHSSYLTLSVLNRSTHISISNWLQGDESCDWSAFPAGNERASLRGLFKQRVIRLQRCSRTTSHVTGQPALLNPADVSHSSLPGPHLWGVRLHANMCTWIETSGSFVNAACTAVYLGCHIWRF